MIIYMLHIYYLVTFTATLEGRLCIIYPPNTE